jgi:hypothetical protein
VSVNVELTHSLCGRRLCQSSFDNVIREQDPHDDGKLVLAAALDSALDIGPLLTSLGLVLCEFFECFAGKLRGDKCFWMRTISAISGTV